MGSLAIAIETDSRVRKLAKSARLRAVSSLMITAFP